MKNFLLGLTKEELANIAIKISEQSALEKAALESEIEGIMDERDASMSEWISVNDRLPEVYESVLVFMPESGQHVLNVSYNELHKKYEWGFPDKWINACDDDVTHWMSLPEPPEAAK